VVKNKKINRRSKDFRNSSFSRDLWKAGP